MTKRKKNRNSTALRINTVPNWLTLFRVALVPVIVGLLFQKSPSAHIWAGWIFALAALTDLLDGNIARYQKTTTVFGQLVDPLADKFIVTASLIMLQELGRIHPSWVILLICRELAITGLRSLAAAEGMIISASQLAKWKTTAQMIALPLMMLDQDYWGLPLAKIADFCFYSSILLSLWTAGDYSINFFKEIQKIYVKES